MAVAQKRVVVYDLETRTPIQKARIRVDRMRTFSTDMLGTFVTPARYDTLEISTPKHLVRKLAASEVGDSIGLLLKAHTLGEVEVVGEDLSKRLQRNVDDWITKDRERNALNSNSGGIVSFDIVNVFDFKGKARRKRTRKVKQALADMEETEEDPIKRAYKNTIKNRRQQEEEQEKTTK